MLRNSLIAAMAVLAMSCTQNVSKPLFTLDGTTHAAADGEAYLYVLLPEYQKLMMLDSAVVKNGRFHFSGEVEEPMEAFVRVKGDTAEYCLVLTNNTLTMNIADGTYSVQGSPSNRALSELLTASHSFAQRRKALQDSYKKMSSDSTLTKLTEDSLMAAYHGEGVAYREHLLARLTKVAPRYPLMGRLALRMFSRDMLQQEVDSVSRLLEQSPL